VLASAGVAAIMLIESSILLTYIEVVGSLTNRAKGRGSRGTPREPLKLRKSNETRHSGCNTAQVNLCRLQRINILRERCPKATNSKAA